MKSLKGIYREGKIELLESPPEIRESQVIVTFLQEADAHNTGLHGLDADQIAELRWRLQTFAEDWDDPVMDVYDAI